VRCQVAPEVRARRPRCTGTAANARTLARTRAAALLPVVGKEKGSGWGLTGGPLTTVREGGGRWERSGGLFAFRPRRKEVRPWVGEEGRKLSNKNRYAL